MRRIGVAAFLLAACVDHDSDQQIGEACVTFDECASGLVCAFDGVCREDGAPGTGTTGDPCVANAECMFGLVCASAGQCAEPGSPGTAGFDEACSETSDCQLGLSCANDVCKGLQLPFWLGAECQPEPEDTAFRVLFEVPAVGAPLADFYRLPYPNDARVHDGVIDLAGHPTPGELIPIVGDPVGNLLSVVSTDTGGRFGANEAILMRLTRFPDTTTVTFGLPGAGSLALVDITPGDTSTDIHPFRWEASSGRTPYICEDWVSLAPIDGRPLTPGHTYAVLVSTDVKDKAGASLVQDADFAALLSTTGPTDARLADGWTAYAPLRDYLTAQNIDPSRVAGGTVFTVEDVRAGPQKLHDAIVALPAPEWLGPILCDGTDDPFAGEPDRGCSPVSDTFSEIQARVGLPQFQDGTPPFKDFGDGGAIDTAGTITAIRTELVHVTLTVPKGVPMPVGGWPLILYGHGTGGSYTSAVREGLAEDLTAIDHGGSTVHFATLGFDAPLHGPRANPDAWRQDWLDVDPDAYAPTTLFFNPLNPRAARDNALQEAADLWSLVQFAKALDLDEFTSPTGAALKLDPSQLYYLGHSQGGVVGPLFAAWEPSVRAVVFSGAGALTIRSLLEKTSPFPLAPALRVGLADPSLSRSHPILNLVQALADGSDGVNHASAILRDPPEGSPKRSVLQLFGRGDTYSPDSTQYALTRALGVDEVLNGQTSLDNVDEVTLPVTENISNGVTGVVVSYPAPAGSDAHYVLFEDADALAHVKSFLASAVLDGTPTVE